MLKRIVFGLLTIMCFFCFLGCPEPEKEGEWFDFAIMGISYSAYVNLKTYNKGFAPNVVYAGNDAKTIFGFVSYHIDKNVGGALEEKKTYQEVVDLLDFFGLPIDLAKKAVGSITAYYYISDAGNECVVFVEDTSSIHSRSVLSLGSKK